MIFLICPNLQWLPFTPGKISSPAYDLQIFLRPLPHLPSSSLPAAVHPPAPPPPSLLTATLSSFSQPLCFVHTPPLFLFFHLLHLTKLSLSPKSPFECYLLATPTPYTPPAWEALTDVVIVPIFPSLHTIVMVGLLFFVCFNCLHFP